MWRLEARPAERGGAGQHMHSISTTQMGTRTPGAPPAAAEGVAEALQAGYDPESPSGSVVLRV